MEDHTQSETLSAKDDKEKIVDLTSDMELSDQTKHRIIDLTDDMDSGDDQKKKQPSEDAQSIDAVHTPEAKDGESANLMTDESEVEKPSVIEDIDLTDDMDSGDDQKEKQPSEDVQSIDAAHVPEAEVGESANLETDESQVEEPSAIEDEVDAAFDAVQSEESVGEKTEENILFEKLTNITQEVDNAVRQMHESESGREPIESPIDPIVPDEQATEPEDENLTVSASNDDEKEIIELTDIVNSAEAAALDGVDNTNHDDIIELVDKVTPEELEAAEIADTDDDGEIIELTDIVDPAELAASDVSSPIEEAGETMDLSADDLFEPSDSIAEEPSADQEEFEIDEIDALFGDDAASAEEQIESTEPEPGSGIDLTDDFDEEKDRHEQVIQLADVLSTTVKEDKAPIEQVKMGAEEDISNQHISVEEEETANALGMDLSEGPGEEQHLLLNKEIERTVAHIIKTKYADTIEQMIANAVEKAVTQEIEKIKLSLSDDEPPA